MRAFVLARHNDGLLRSARVYAWLVLAGAGVAGLVGIGARLAWRLGGAADVRATVAAAGVWAPLLFLAVHTVVTVSPIPSDIRNGK